MSIESGIIYGFRFDYEDITDETKDKIEEMVSKHNLDQIYEGDPIPGFDATAIGIELDVSPYGISVEDFIKEIQDAKEKLTDEILNDLEENLDVYVPEIIFISHVSC